MRTTAWMAPWTRPFVESCDAWYWNTASTGTVLLAAVLVACVATVFAAGAASAGAIAAIGASTATTSAEVRTRMRAARLLDRVGLRTARSCPSVRCSPMRAA